MEVTYSDAKGEWMGVGMEMGLFRYRHLQRSCSQSHSYLLFCELRP